MWCVCAVEQLYARQMRSSVSQTVAETTAKAQGIFQRQLAALQGKQPATQPPQRRGPAGAPSLRTLPDEELALLTAGTEQPKPRRPPKVRLHKALHACHVLVQSHAAVKAEQCAVDATVNAHPAQSACIHQSSNSERVVFPHDAQQLQREPGSDRKCMCVCVCVVVFRLRKVPGPQLARVLLLLPLQ